MDRKRCLLHQAIIYGNTEICKYYINSATSESFQLACQYKNLDVVKLLVCNSHVNTNESKNFAFILACNESNFEIVSYLYSLGNIDINMNKEYGQSPLNIALRNRDYRLVEWILSIQ